MQKEPYSPKENKQPKNNKDAKCTSPCRECVMRHTCPDVCPLLKKHLED